MEILPMDIFAEIFKWLIRAALTKICDLLYMDLEIYINKKLLFDDICGGIKDIIKKYILNFARVSSRTYLTFKEFKGAAKIRGKVARIIC